jgi:hypothetical protein
MLRFLNLFSFAPTGAQIYLSTADPGRRTDKHLGARQPENDGAAFVSVSEKNCTLTIAALAWQASEYLTEEFRTGKL